MGTKRPRQTARSFTSRWHHLSERRLPGSTAGYRCQNCSTNVLLSLFPIASTKLNRGSHQRTSGDLLIFRWVKSNPYIMSRSCVLTMITVLKIYEVVYLIINN